MSNRSQPTLQRRLFGWLLALTLVPALLILAIGGWAVSTSLELAGALGPWEEVAETGRQVVERVEPGADPDLEAVLQRHRQALSGSLTQARRWSFLGERFLDVLPLLVLGVAVALSVLALAASRLLARELARPIEALVAVAERMGREEPLPPPGSEPVREVRVLDRALRDAAAQLAAGRERAVAAERLRVWGEMARRVAHEMKNPLTPLRLAAHRLRRPADAAAVADAAEVIGQEVARLEELAAQFSALGRPPEGPPTEVDVPELLRTLLETDIPPAVRTSLDAPAGAPMLLGHYDALVRAFRNLLRNAVEATTDVPAPAIEVVIRPVPDPAGAGGWLETRIADNGTGLPGDDAGRIFEPDFTTKKRGTGLGLALVRQAVETHGGSVAVESGDAGATFVVRLPLPADGGPPRSERTEHATRSS